MDPKNSVMESSTIKNSQRTYNLIFVHYSKEIIRFNVKLFTFYTSVILIILFPL